MIVARPKDSERFESENINTYTCQGEREHVLNVDDYVTVDENVGCFCCSLCVS